MLATLVQAQEIALTPQEEAWLKAHPVITLGVTRDFPPYEWIDEKSQYVGPVAEYMHLLEKKLGVQFKVVHDRPWSEILEMAKKGELDLLSCVNKTPERSQFLTFTEPYKSTHIVIIDNGQGIFIGGLEELAGKRVSVENAYFMQEFMQNNHPKIHVIPAANTAKALDMAVSGAADAYVGDAGTANYFIRKGALFSLRFTGQTEYDSQYRIGVSQTRPELVAIIDKAIATIPKDESEAIFNRWLGLKIEEGIQFRTLINYAVPVFLLLLLFGYWVLRLRGEISERKQAESSLKYSEEQLRLVLEGAEQGFWDWDIASGTVERNQRWAEMLGYTYEEIKHTPQQWIDFIHPDDRERAWRSISDVLEGHALSHKAEYRMLHNDGSIRWIFDQANVMKRDRNGVPTRMSGTHTDITERKRNEEFIAKERFLGEQALELAQAGHWSIDFSEGDEYYISSPRLVEIFGDPPREGFRYHILNDWFVNLEAADKKLAYATLANYLAAVEGTVQRYDMTHPYKRPSDGRIVWVHVLGHVVRDLKNKPTHVYGVVMDVTQQKLFEDKLEYQAHFDYLTGVSNRGYFVQQAELEIARAARYKSDLSIGMMDIDHFKQINDTYGHKVGDLVLKKLADICRMTLREVDIIGRIGGEEFALLFPETSIEEANEVAERLRVATASVRIPIESGLPISFTVSIGISSMTSPDNNLDVLLNLADKGLYAAKTSGRNRVGMVTE